MFEKKLLPENFEEGKTYLIHFYADVNEMGGLAGVVDNYGAALALVEMTLAPKGVFPYYDNVQDCLNGIDWMITELPHTNTSFPEIRYW